MHVVIVNPIAGRGRTREAARQVSAHFEALGLPHRLDFTQAPGHATALARAAAEAGVDALWVLGGDGTLHEAVEGLAGTDTPLGLLPMGTGNDFARSVGVPAGDIAAAFAAQDPARTREIDLWMANDRAFVNIAGVGFDCETLLHTRKYKKLPGSMLPYLLGLLTAIFTHKNVPATATLDGVPIPGPYLMVTCANGQYFGGGMRVAPDADPRDGLLDVVLIRGMRRGRVPFLLPKFFKARHIELKCTSVVRARDILLTAPTPMWVECDGELFQSERVHIRRCERGLRCMALSTTNASAN